ncbi:MAG: ATP-grasp domain-containing protein [Candidatus Hermodarchaeota archaeon]|nr:ATP-grasp domain-containing protein [Candidatus Hermodarchaeota archaeon]MDO8125201.1 ATP-grasp domain-containing protein [Candidatus Hermodarchaeota archaeon]
MRKLKILLTACGCPGASTLIRMLKNNGERPIEIIGTDMDNEAVGRFLCDGFYQVPGGHSEEYIPRMLEITKKEEPDILFPESSYEVYPLAQNVEEFEAIGTHVLVSNPEPISIASDKLGMYETLQKKTALNLPRYFSVNSLEGFLQAAEKLGYPESPIVFKPHIGKGSRGVRILDASIQRREHLLQHKPQNKFMSLAEFEDIFRGDIDFPELLVMEFLDGPELTCDSLAFEGRELLTTTKTVEQARWGVIVKGELVDRPDLVNQTQQILEAIPLSYCVNVQFVADKLIEINPRVSTFIYQRDLIVPYLAVKLALQEITESEVMSYKSRVEYGRRMVRYMDQIFHTGGRRVQ